MELFSEIYDCYYTVVAQILRRAHSKGLTRSEIDSITAESAFSESGLHLIPRLFSSQWDLLKEKDGRYASKLSSPETALPLTGLQKAVKS